MKLTSLPSGTILRHAGIAALYDDGRDKFVLVNPTGAAADLVIIRESTGQPARAVPENYTSSWYDDHGWLLDYAVDHVP